MKRFFKSFLCLLLAAVIMWGAVPMGAAVGETDIVEPLVMRYDDRLDVTGKTVEIMDAGTSVVALDNNMLIATDIGSAKVKIDGVLYQVTVEKAKLNLIMVVGQSNSGNHFPNATSAVTCPPGTAYYWGYGATVPVDYTEPSMGFHAPLLAELYAQSSAAGDPVKNVLVWSEGYTSKNGKSITAWAVEKDGGIDTTGTDGAVQMLKDCLAYYESYSNYYVIKNKIVFCNHGTTDHNMDVQRYMRLFIAMWDRLKDAGMEYLAFLRVRGAHSLNTSQNQDTYYNTASAAQFELVRTREDMFMASTIAEGWTGPASTSYSIDVSDYITMTETYGKAAQYSDNYGNHATYADGVLTTTMKELYGSNNKVHYGIFGYGLIGADAAFNMYTALSDDAEIHFVQADSSGLKSAEQIAHPGTIQSLNIENIEHELSFYPGCGSPAGKMDITVVAEGVNITDAVISKESDSYGCVRTNALLEYVKPVITVRYICNGKVSAATYNAEFNHPCNPGHSYSHGVCTACGAEGLGAKMDGNTLSISGELERGTHIVAAVYSDTRMVGSRSLLWQDGTITETLPEGDSVKLFFLGDTWQPLREPITLSR